MLPFVKDSGPGVGDVHVDGALGARTPADMEAERKANLRSAAGAVNKRQLHANDADTAKSPFPYDPNALGNLRPDQVPRFFGALTDADKLPTKDVRLNSLTAMQDRVDPKKVKDIADAGGGEGGKPPVVVRHGGKNYIADGHHRLAADWLAGKDKATVAFKDLEPIDNALKSAGEFATFFKAAGVDEGLGLVYGWGIVCKENGVDYYDVQKNHIPEPAMVAATTEFMKDSRMAGEQHARMDAGTIVHSFPLTTEIAKAMGLETTKTGWMVAAAPDAAMLAKFKSGDLTGFSIGGEHLELDGQPVGDVQ